MAKAFLLLGSNQGDREGIFRQAEALLKERCGEIQQRSACYETAPWGYVSESLFLNRLLLLTTSIPPLMLLGEMLAIEQELGRVREDDGLQKQLYTDRPIDIDLIFYDDLVINLPELQLPHPRMHERRFVLVPMVELAADLLHPLFGLTMRQLLDRCNDPLQVVAVS